MLYFNVIGLSAKTWKYIYIYYPISLCLVVTSFKASDLLRISAGCLSYHDSHVLYFCHLVDLHAVAVLLKEYLTTSKVYIVGPYSQTAVNLVT